MWWHMFCTLFYPGKSYTFFNDICNDISQWHIAMMYPHDMHWWHITMTYAVMTYHDDIYLSCFGAFGDMSLFRVIMVSNCEHMSSDMSLGGVSSRYVIVICHCICHCMSLRGFRTSVMTYPDDISWWHIMICHRDDMSSWRYVIMIPVCHHDDMSSWYVIMTFSLPMQR